GAEALGMQKAGMAQVEQVLVDQPRLGSVVELTMAVDIVGMAEADHWRKQSLIRRVWITHPHPNPPVALRHRIRADAQARGDPILPWNLHHTAAVIVEQSVVHAAQPLAL